MRKHQYFLASDDRSRFMLHNTLLTLHKLGIMMKQRISYRRVKIVRIGFLALCCAALLTACANNMRNDSRLKPYEASPVFDDGKSERPIDPNTVPRSQADLRVASGKADGAVISEFPISVSRDTLVRGQTEYGIYCTPCHGAAADGKGVVSGYFNPKPANLLDPALLSQPVGHYFDVISNGKGIMYSYASRISPEDRWAIIAFIRALQANQQAPLDVPPEQIQQAGATAGGTAR
jgi:mono/diheme cytochrome c family protein